ncbi:MAG: PAS domain S-box protein, partial [Anaerolineae bacterium]
MTRLLIVEDDPAGRYQLQVLLEGSGYEVDLAVNGVEALAIAGEDPPQLVISDILMPEMDGFMLCRNWKRDPQLQNIPFVFYTATYTDNRDEEFARSLGADEFIVKPMEPDEFLAIIRQILADYADGRLTPAKIPDETGDDAVLQAYNMALVRKLEDKMAELKTAYATLDKKHRQLRLLREIDRAISETLDLEEILDKLAGGVMQALALSRCSVWLLEPGGKFLRGRGYGLNTPGPEVEHILLPSDNPLVAHVFESKRPLPIPDVTAPEYAQLIDPQFIKSFDIAAILLAPLIQNDTVIGFLVLDDTQKPRMFSPDEITLVESAATQAVVAIEKARLFTAVAGSESRYRNIFEGIRDAILVEDMDGNILDANESACKLYGYSRAELLSKKIPDLVAPESPVLMADQIVTPEQPFVPIENINIRANGERFPVELTATIHQIGGKDVMLVAVRDVSARLEAESQMRLQSAALEATANAIFITDNNGKILWANLAFTKLTGYQLDEIIGRTPRFLKSNQHDDSFYAKMWQTILAGKTWQGKLVNRCKDGALYVDEQTITPVKDEQGAITHFVAIKRNVTHREETATALAEYAARLEYLRSLDQAILQSATMTQLAELVLESMEKMIPCNGAGVALFDSERGSAEVLARCGDTAVLPPAGSQMSLADFDYTASDTPFTSILMDDLETTTLSAREIKRLVSQGVRAFLHVPLLSDDKLVGAIQLGANRPGTFTETHLQMVRELAGQLAIGFQNAALAEEKRRRTQEMEAVTKAAAAMRQAKDRESMPP